jgi:hypothetical protein
MLMKAISRLILMLAGLPLAAQQGRGTIFGTVTDPAGAAVPAASVVVTNTSTNFTFRTETNSEGYFTTPALIVGPYSVAVAANGFKKAVRTGVTLEVDQRAPVNVTLEIGSVAESIEVTGAAPLVDVSSAAMGKVVENRRIQDLPLNGRNVFNLVLLTPNVRNNSNATGSGIAERGVAVANISINGGQGGYNAFSIDGGNAQNTVLNEVNVNPAPDAVQEFKVQSVAASAEYGFTLGGTVSVATKSGANEFHGSLYEFLRNDAFDARNAFSRTKAPLRYNQYGGAAGGPVWIPKIYDGHNRSFFFVNYEAYRHKFWGDNYATVPPMDQRGGDFSNLRDARGTLIPIFDPATTQVNPSGSGYVRQPFAGNLVPKNRFDPVTVKMLEFPAVPNATPTNVFQNTNNLFFRSSGGTESYQTAVRFDQRITDRNTMYVRYMDFWHRPLAYTGGVVPWAINGRDDRYKTRNAVVSDTHTFSPRVLNDLRLSLSRQYFTFGSPTVGQGWPKKLGLPDGFADVFPIANFGLATASGFNGTIGPGFVGNIRAGVGLQLFESVTMIFGKHSLKAGTEIRRTNGVAGVLAPANAGAWNFSGLTTNPQAATGTGSGLAQFLLGAVSSGSVTANGATTIMNHSASFFLQDDWRITRRLNLNLGLRYDYQQSPFEAHNRFSNFNIFETNPLTKLPGLTQYADQTSFPGIRGGKPNLSPRIGFAHDLRGDGRTALRGAYSIFYASMHNIAYSTSGYGTFSTPYDPPNGNSNFPAFQFSKGLPSPWLEPRGNKLGPSINLSSGAIWVQANQPAPMSQQWNLSLQHQFKSGWMVEGAYTGNKGTHLEARAYDYNQLDDKYYPQYQQALNDQLPNPYAGIIPGALGGTTIPRSQLLKAIPYVGSITVGSPSNLFGNSFYNALVLTAEKRMSKGLAMLASYTYGKAIGDSLYSNIDFASEQGNSDGYQTGKYDRRRERSLDSQDVRHRLVVSLVYELPFGKGRRFAAGNRVADSVIGGWQVNTITTGMSGLPLVVRGANNFRANRPDSTGISARLENHNANLWINPAAFINPPNWTLGNLGRTLPDARRPGVFNVDFSLIKDTRLTERLRLQFRAEAFNAMNHVNLGAPNTTFTAGADGRNVNANFGKILSARSARNGQFALKLIF